MVLERQAAWQGLAAAEVGLAGLVEMASEAALEAKEGAQKVELALEVVDLVVHYLHSLVDGLFDLVFLH